MAICVFGVANHSPEDVVSALLKSRLRVKAGEIGVLPPESRADTRFKYLLVLSTRDFVRNKVVLDATDTKVFIFSNPIDLCRYEGVCLLDFSQKDSLTFEYRDLDINLISKSRPKPIRRLQNSFLPQLIQSVQHGSLLNSLMTFIYSLSSQNQTKVKVAAVQFMCRAQSVAKLRTEVADCLTERAIDKLVELVTSDVAEKYSAALAQISASKKCKAEIDLASTAKQHGVSSYELSYMLSVLANPAKASVVLGKSKIRKPTKRRK